MPHRTTTRNTANTSAKRSATVTEDPRGRYENGRRHDRRPWDRVRRENIGFPVQTGGTNVRDWDGFYAQLGSTPLTGTYDPPGADDTDDSDQGADHGNYGGAVNPGAVVPFNGVATSVSHEQRTSPPGNNEQRTEGAPAAYKRHVIDRSDPSEQYEVEFEAAGPLQGYPPPSTDPAYTSGPYGHQQTFSGTETYDAEASPSVYPYQPAQYMRSEPELVIASSHRGPYMPPFNSQTPPGFFYAPFPSHDETVAVVVRTDDGSRR